MLRIALPNKGSLSEGAVKIVSEASYRCKRSSRELTVLDPANSVEFIFLRPCDIPVYVSGGVIDVGISGRDLALDSEAEFAEILPLGFGKSTFRYAVPAESGLVPEKFGGLRIATSYPNLVRRDMLARGIDATPVRLDGAVEVSVRLGVADAIADVVQTGRTLVEAGLKMVGQPVLESEAIVLARHDRIATDNPEVAAFLRRLQGIVVARDYIMVEYDVPVHVLDQACRVTPGIESPTVAPLNEPDWKAVKSMARRKDVNRIMDDLSDLGAKGIIITDIRTCRI
jgi:ATP phosphoribosyltransferase